MGAVAMRGTVVDMEGSLVGAKLAEAEGRMAEVGMAVDAGVARGWTLWRAAWRDSEEELRLADMGVGMEVPVGMEVEVEEKEYRAETVRVGAKVDMADSGQGGGGGSVGRGGGGGRAVAEATAQVVMETAKAAEMGMRGAGCLDLGSRRW
ncbi:hypothetical protein CYMTET_6790 [Cymbomonas tetramitiformis]|uniref:Uncharacterized protein n=1 Tax=Cymbomonas tetramitiformis TaxID=36881 RepID=A0AAE0GWR1_9CHLO|nr:hypothetical protein CYMTET_6790 [Cymbomonas tetramitiformis]